MAFKFFTFRGLGLWGLRAEEFGAGLMMEHRDQKQAWGISNSIRTKGL